MKQQGLVLVFSLLILMSLTILGVTSVSSSLMQNKMSVSMEKRSLAFDAAEAAISGVVFEAEDPVILGNQALLDPLSEARQDVTLDLNVTTPSCFDTVNWTSRQITSVGLTPGTQHVTAGSYNSNPATTSWSKTAFVGERSCLGSSNVVGGSSISCHVFVVRGCGQLIGSPYAVVNTLNASVFAPATN